MPYFSVETNLTMQQESKQALAEKISGFVAHLLGKPEAYIMISIKPDAVMTFAGAGGPAAFVQVKSIGLSKEKCPILSEKICGFLEQELKIPKDRVFIDFKDLDGSMFGWNGKTF